MYNVMYTQYRLDLAASNFNKTDIITEALQKKLVLFVLYMCTVHCSLK